MKILPHILSPISSYFVKILLRFYQVFIFILTPVWFIWLLLRLSQKKELITRLCERWGKSTVQKPHGSLLWIHAASVGESLSALPLIKKIQEYSPDLNILMTTGTVTSARLMAGRLPQNVIHQFFPMDMLLFVHRFLSYWRPDGVLWLESELWPTMLSETRQKKIPMALVNARLSPKSFQRWQRFPVIADFLLRQFNICLAQSGEMAFHLKSLGAQHVRMPGNLKYASPPLPVDLHELAQIKKKLKMRVILCVASTHPGEEEKIFYVHQKIKQHLPNFLTILVPRHPERGQEIKEAGLRKNLTVSRRSLQEPIYSQTDIYLADTLGELGLFYRLSPIVLMGGTLMPIGGHNPLEPALLDCALLWGRHMENFSEISHRFIQEKAAIQLSTEEEIIQALLDLIKHPKKVKALQRNAQNLAKSEQCVLDHILDDIRPFFPFLTPAFLNLEKEEKKNV